MLRDGEDLIELPNELAKESSVSFRNKELPTSHGFSLKPNIELGRPEQLKLALKQRSMHALLNPNTLLPCIT